MADQGSVRQRIISSVFSRRNAGGSTEENYVAHVKIWEDGGPEGGGRKPRYILLSKASNGTGFIHKSKLNSNGSFSVGKTWRLAELRAVQVFDPLNFNITLSRTYKWQTENQIDQSTFLAALVRLFRTVTSGAAALQLEGFPDPDAASSQNNYIRSARTPSPNELSAAATGRSPLGMQPKSSSQGDRGYEFSQRVPSPLPRSRSRAELPSRPTSPANSLRSHLTSSSLPRDAASSYDRSPSSSSQLPSSTVIRTRQPRRPSNATSTSSQIPSSRPVPGNTRGPSSDTNQSLSVIRASQDDPFTPASVYAPSPARSRTGSPTSFDRSRKHPARSRTTNGPTDGQPPRRDHNARVSFFDTANQAALDRLIMGSAGGQPEVEGEENAQATMTNVEEMIEGYEWASEDIIGRKPARGAADLIEARLLDELMALEKANIHSFLESDDRIGIVMKYMDEAISELENMGSLVSSYKIHLNAVSDDISYIQSQNRGLQVQTQNQRALLGELTNLLQTAHVDKEALTTLNRGSLEQTDSIQKLEEAASDLYKALQAGRDTDMAATMERLQEYRTHNAQFCKRMLDFLSIMFTAQSKLLLGDSDGIAKSGPRPVIINHQDIEAYLGRYAGLMLYLKEMDETTYAKICAAYFSAASDLHRIQIKSLLTTCANLVKKGTEDDQDPSFSAASTVGASKGGTGIRRTGTATRSPVDGRQRDREKGSNSDLRVSEAFGLVLEQLAPQVYREDDFIADFLQINDAALTFADYMGLDNYFRRQAARAAGLTQSTVKLVRNAMDLIFGFLPAELKTWLDNSLAKDSMQVIGVLACLERFLMDADERGNQFFLNLLEKQHTRLKGLFERHVNEQIREVEQTKLTSKKRKGVVHFVKHFPIYIGYVENQLIVADGLEIRASVDNAYERIVQTMFECLKQMAKLDGEDEDKSQLNFHVMLIENMHHFVAEISQLEVGSVAVFLKRAEAIYDENLNAYVKIVFRRPFMKIIDYFDGVERLLKTTAPSEVATNGTYNKAALKKVVKEYSAKDIRKHVDALFKRVEKHFTEASEKTTTEESGGIVPGTVLVGVWKACEDELLRITELFSKRISQCYAGSGVTLDYTAADVAAAFRRQRVAL